MASRAGGRRQPEVIDRAVYRGRQRLDEAVRDLRLRGLAAGLWRLPPPTAPVVVEGLVIDEGAVGDAPVVAALSRHAFAQYADNPHPPRWAMDASTESMVEQLCGGGVVMAWLDGVPVGAFTFKVRRTFFRGRLLAVHERAQGRGIGQALILGVHRVAAARGYPYILGATDTDMTRNRQIYDHIGLVEGGTFREGRSVRYLMPIVPKATFAPPEGSRVVVDRAMRREGPTVRELEALAGLAPARRGRGGGSQRGAIMAFIDRVAVGSVRFEIRAGHVVVGRLVVLPAARGRGVAGQLLAALAGLPEVRAAGELRGTLPGDDPRLAGLFERAGWRIGPSAGERRTASLRLEDVAAV